MRLDSGDESEIKDKLVGLGYLVRVGSRSESGGRRSIFNRKEKR
jgi:hypothetical protein